MIQRFAGVLLLVVVGGSGPLCESVPLPKDVPPVLGMAVRAETGTTEADGEWTIKLSLPKIAWEVTGEMVPKKTWPELKADVEVSTLTLRMGGPSALRPSRFVDLHGKDLSPAQVREQLAKETPVLVSLSGRMPDPYFLQLTKADALIVILGPRDGSPAPEHLPAKKAAPK